jgi:alpha 1,6-mannosyltransferase
MQTQPLRPVEHWGSNTVEYLDISPTDGLHWESKMSAHPAIIIGIEQDRPLSPSPADWTWQRPTQICQWTISGVPNHPIYIDIVRRIVDNTDQAKLQPLPVIEWTGPGPFTDAVMQEVTKPEGWSGEADQIRYLESRYKVSWHRLQGLSHPIRIGEIMILPKIAFEPSKSWFSAEQRNVQADLVHHCK